MRFFASWMRPDGRGAGSVPLCRAAEYETDGDANALYTAIDPISRATRQPVPEAAPRRSARGVDSGRIVVHYGRLMESGRNRPRGLSEYCVGSRSQRRRKAGKAPRRRRCVISPRSSNDAASPASSEPFGHLVCAGLLLTVMAGCGGRVAHQPTDGSPSVKSGASAGQTIGPGGERGIYHRLEEGQTLYRLSLLYDVPLDRLLVINRIDDPTDIPSGSPIFIPGAKRQLPYPG